MGVYLSIVSGALKLFNYIAAALQQHHDEMNGKIARDNETKSEVLADVQRVNSARSDGSLADRVHEQSARD